MKEIKYYSQCGQDKMVLEILGYKKKGFYIDIGANDGITFSNTKVMDNLDWGGVCIEPDCDVFKKLKENRKKSININAAISDKNGTAKFTKISGRAQMLSGLSDTYSKEHLERIKKETEQNGDRFEEVEINTMTFDAILKGIPNIDVIDFVSIDTEGSEFEILKSIDFKKWNISVLAVENNYCDDEVLIYMKKQGYYVRECKSDDIFIKNTLKNVKKQTLISKLMYMNRRRFLAKIKLFRGKL